MQNILLPSPTWYEPLIFLLCFIGLAVIRASNSNYLLAITGIKQLIKKGATTETENKTNKSSFFLVIGYLLITSVWIKIGFKLNELWSITIAITYFSIMFLAWFAFDKVAKSNPETESFSKKRLALLEANVVVTFFFVVLHFYLSLPISYLFAFVFISMLIVWVRTVQLLFGHLSISHIILYLCALEILPFFLMIKAIIKYLM